MRRRLLPRLERGRRRLNGAVDVLRRARRDSGDDRIVCRIDDLEGLASGAVDPLAADELLVGPNLLEDLGHWWVLLGGASRGAAAMNQVSGR